MNFAQKILMENATSFKERHEILALTESDATGINNALINNLYQSAIDKGHINFDSIPDSQGDITKYEGYASMKETINLLTEMADVQKAKMPELQIVTTAITNIESLKPYYEKGFKLNRDFVMLQYNTIVLATVEATSILLSSYVDYVRKVNEVEVVIVKNKKLNGALCLDSLAKYNQCVIKGDMAMILKKDTEGDNFVGSAAIAIPVVGALLVALPMLRELVYYYYNARMSASDYLNQQAQFLELNKDVVMARGNISAKEKNAIVKKQQAVARQLETVADKIKVNHITAETKTKKELTSEQKSWSLDSLSSQATSQDANGFKLF